MQIVEMQLRHVEQIAALEQRCFLRSLESKFHCVRAGESIELLAGGGRG